MIGQCLSTSIKAYFVIIIILKKKAIFVNNFALYCKTSVNWSDFHLELRITRENLYSSFPAFINNELKPTNSFHNVIIIPFWYNIVGIIWMKIIDKTDQARKRSFLWSPKFFTAQAVTMICHVQNDNRTL